MPSFTSNSEVLEVEELLVVPPAKLNRKPVAALLLSLAAALIVLEIGATFWSHSISDFGRRMDSQYSEALRLRPGAQRGPKSVLIVGNSTLRLGIDAGNLKQDVNPALDVHIFSLDQTTYGDWYLGLDHLFRKGARPDFAVLLLPPGQMSQIFPPTDDAAHYFVGIDEMMEAMQQDHLTLTGWSNVVFAHFSTFFARRNSLRLGIKKRMFPGFQALATRYMTRKPASDFSLLPQRFQELNRLCAQYGVRLLYVIPPTNQEDDTIGAAPALQAAGAAGIPAALPVPNSQLNDDMYADGYHLNEAGRRIFTRAMAEFLRNASQPRAVAIVER